MSANPKAVATLASIDAERARLCALLLAADAPLLAKRSAGDEWSPLENARHLLFAEQLHFAQLLPDKQPWSTRGLAPHFLADEPPFRTVGTEPTTDIREVLRAWDAIHAVTADLASSPDDKVGQALDRNLEHLKYHVAIIEALLNAGTNSDNSTR